MALGANGEREMLVRRGRKGRGVERKGGEGDGFNPQPGVSKTFPRCKRDYL